jgi:molecular chaperone HtpG
MSVATETHTFQAETRQLLDLMIHSLYTHKEIFLRELISNASDALDRLRFEALTRPELLDAAVDLGVQIEIDPTSRTLVIHDNGIGMTREELIENIGTIAKSGTRELMRRAQGQGAEGLGQLIGQFGVGFYSAFMVADEVRVLTRRAGTTEAWLWRSTGDGTFTVEPSEREGAGTSISLHLKPAEPEQGLPDFADEWTVSGTVKRYSDFLTYPIVLHARREKRAEDPSPEGESASKTPAETVIEKRTLNSMKPLWTRDKSEVTTEELNRFYRQVSHDWTDPARTIWVRAEGRCEYRGILFIPSKAPHDLFYVGSKPGLQLYARKVMIMESCEALMPRYLRFVRGVVDSPDLPLNVSREMLQHDGSIGQIRRGLTRKVLDAFADIQRDEPSQYTDLWTEFGRALKEGVADDSDNREHLLRLLAFQSSADPTRLTTLAEYVARMPEGQDKLYYLTGESRAQVESSPLLEAYLQRGHEVLFMIDPVDELLMQTLTEFDGRRFKSVGKGSADLGAPAEREAARTQLEEKQTRYKALLEALQTHLTTHVKEVRLTDRLTQSPVCLVGAEHDYSPQLERLLQKGKGGGAAQRRILELNPEHPLLTKLHERFERDPQDPRVGEYADLLFGHGLLAEGASLPDPARFNRLMASLMVDAL